VKVDRDFFSLLYVSVVASTIPLNSITDSLSLCKFQFDDFDDFCSDPESTPSSSGGDNTS
ncbi:hypothetical protein A2U01_0091723, partial [Trifolium medium]|nr:hypothetical protein [Trifolium medium]